MKRKKQGSGVALDGAGIADPVARRRVLSNFMEWGRDPGEWGV